MSAGQPGSINPEGANCVQNGDNHNAFIGENGEPHIGITDGTEDNAENLYAD